MNWSMIRGLLAVGLLAACLSAETRAQTIPISCDLTPPPPLGAWTHDISFASEFVYPIQTIPPSQGKFAEIAHAALLPPPVDDPGLSEAQKLALDRVLLAVRPGCAASIDGQQSQVWLWNPAAPRRLENLPMFGAGLPAPAALAGDPFCCGMTHFDDGDLFLASGLDYPSKCATTGCVVGTGGIDLNMAVGHKYTYRLDIGVDPPRWLGSADGWRKLSKTEHYYSTLITRESGNPEIFGSAGAPNPTCPTPYSAWPPPPPANPADYSAPIDQMREEYDQIASAFVQRINRSIPSGACSTTADPKLSLGDYPRTHVTGDGWLVVTNSGFQDAQHVFVPAASFMDLNAPCPASDWRWRPQQGTPAALDRDGGSSVLIIHRNPVTLLRESVIYAVGGTAGDDFDVAANPSLVSASVQKMVVAASNAPASSWVNAPALSTPRANHNTLMLPNAEMIVVGGINNTASPVLSLARYRPPELFPGEGLVWEQLPAQLQARPYHSVALVLRDGRVISVGGSEPYDSWHSLEIYAPEYYFSTIRPSITSWPKPTQGTIQYAGVGIGDTFVVEAFVHFCPPVQPFVKRVVLLGAGNPTHAFDSNQRYVELDFFSADLQSPNNKLLTVTKPTQFEAPPGYYMLFVVDGRDRPSIGQWVRFGH